MESPSRTTTAPTPRPAIAEAASPSVASAGIVRRLRVMCSETSGMGRFYDLGMAKTRATGRCLCGAVAYEVRGPLRDVLLCHCVECRRWSGYVGAFTAAQAEHLVVEDDAAVRWIASPESDRHAPRA